MTSHPNATRDPKLPGNDGSWFLEAIGAQVAEPANTNGQPIAPNPQPAEPGSSPYAEATVGATTSERYRDALSNPVTEDALTDFTPQQLDPRLDSSRSWQWPIVVSAGVLLLAIVSVAVWLPRASEGRAQESTAEYVDGLTAVWDDLASAQQALATLTDPEADVSSFGTLVAPITTFRVNSDNAVNLASEPLPSPLPMASSEPFDALVPLRDGVATYGTNGAAIARRLADLLEYRSTFNSFLDTGPLPTTASSDDLDALGTTLATASVDGATILAQLPNDAALADHKAAAEVVLLDFSDDQLGYVDALRTGNAAVATAFVDSLLADRANLDRLLAEALRRMRTEVDLELVGLSGDIAAILDGEAAR